jgi:hypothetical protein
MVGVLILIGATIYNQRSRAQMGKAAADDLKQPAEDWSETIVAGPTDEDALEQEDARRLFEAVEDKSTLLKFEMPAYWKLMKWARSQSFAELEERARRDVPITKLWQEPTKHRGELIRLRLHVQRIVDWEPSKNPAGVKTAYEVWGVTDESLSVFYAVVCSELPPAIPVETNAHSEAVFVGYFLKVLAYTAGNEKPRYSPLLIGRVKAVTVGKTASEARTEGFLSMVAIGLAIVVAGIVAVALWRTVRSKRPGRVSTATVSTLPDADVEAWLENPTDADAGAEPSHATPSTNGSSHPDE